jgi:ribosomal-protein-alanine N-acetyltransferase
MRRADLDPVLQIERSSFPEPWPRRFFEEEVTGNDPARALVALTGGEIVGYLVSWDLAGEIHIGNIAVAERHRRLGIAQALLDAVVGEAGEAGLRSITLEVRATNRAAIALYARNLFRPVGLRKGYYRGKEDAIIMTRELGGR